MRNIRTVAALFVHFILQAANLSATTAIDYSIWELQKPDNSTVTSTRLQANYTDAYFYIAPDGGQVFMDTQTGKPTSGSQHPRTELRELSGGSAAAWAPTNNNIMTVKGTVIQVGGGTRGHTTLGQVFDSTGGFPLCEFQYHNRVAGFAIFYEEAKGAGTYINLDTPMSLNTEYTFILSLSNNVLTITINGTQAYNATIGTAVQDDKFYFKCGNYDQTATSGTVTMKPYTIVENYSISVEHNSGTCATPKL